MQNSKWNKRIFALLLCIVMLGTILPMQVFAEDGDDAADNPTTMSENEALQKNPEDETIKNSKDNDAETDNDSTTPETEENQETDTSASENAAENSEDEDDAANNVANNVNAITEESEKEGIALLSEPEQSSNSLSAYITHGSDTVNLTAEGSSQLNNVGWADTLSLHVEATFGAGKNKTIEISIPVGMTFHTTESSIYKVNNVDETLKNQINPNQQTDSAKANVTVLGINQYNGTITLQFNSTGEDNDAQKVAFDVPLALATKADYNTGFWESGTCWFYDNISNPVKVTQSMDNAPDNTLILGEINVKNNETKSYGTNWKAAYYPEVKLGESTTGDESFWVYPNHGNATYRHPTAYKYYSITYIAPEGAKFVRLNSTSSYNGVDYVVTNAGETTDRGYTVPAGYKAYTWTITDAVARPDAELTVCPVFNFPSDKFEDGDLATISVADLHVRYYGRNYSEGEEENYDSTKYPSLTYKIGDEYEEVFANTYQTKDKKDEARETNFYEADYVLDLGAPGFEHSQERLAGYYFIGNRGFKDSAPKTITFEFDVKNTGAIGVTEVEVPSLVESERYQVSNVQYQVWNSETNETTGWTNYNYSAQAGAAAKSSTINLSDLGIEGGSGIYIKAIRMNISTIPKQAYLKNGKSTGSSANIDYRFYCNVLTNEAIAAKADGQIENKMTIANQSGDVADATDTSGRSVYGRAYVGTSGQSLIIGNNVGYDIKLNDNNTMKVGSGSHDVYSFVHFHDWSIMNAQLVEKIYLISPFGEEYTNIQMHYESSREAGNTNGGKKYQKSVSEPQPHITEIPASGALKEKYPKAKVYVLDFSAITDPQQKYDARQVGGNVMSTKSYNNTPLSTASKYTGVWVSFDYAPDISDPTGAYNDVFWVEYNADTTVPIAYKSSGWNTNIYSDTYELSSSQQWLGKMHGFTLTPTEGLTVSSSAKQKQETDAWYRTYDGTEDTILGLASDAKYRLTISNESSLSANGLSVYWPVPKTGENWGEMLCPEGAFKYSLNLANALVDVPEGYEVYYAKNVTPTGQYENWDTAGWVSQEETAGWGSADWRAVNFVKLKWVGTSEVTTINYGEDKEAVFDLTVDTLTTTSEQMYTLDVWRPYFLREYTQSSSWISGKPVACILTPGRITGKVWDDANCDGAIDTDEQLLEEVKVELYDLSTEEPILRAITKTDSNGEYVFDGLKDGTAESGKADNCKIVVYRPSRDGDSYIGFTKDGKDMNMNRTPDRLTAYVQASPNKDVSGEKGYNAGLIRSIIYVIPETDITLECENPDYPIPDKYVGIPFTAKITSDKESQPLPEKESVTSGNSFGTLAFKEVGTYEYTIVPETALPDEYSKIADVIRYDSTKYTLTVEVSFDSDENLWTATGTISKETPKLITLFAEGVTEEQKTFEFVNVLPCVDVTIQVVKTLEGKDLEADEFTFDLKADNTAAEEDVLLYTETEDRTYTSATAPAVVSAKNTEDGKVIFDTLTYFLPGTYAYIVSEETGSIGGIIYDNNQYEVTVVVSLKDGTLEVEKTIQKDGETADDITFNNIVYGNLAITKTVTGNKADKSEKFNFTVTFDQDGEYAISGIDGKTTIKSGDTIQLKHGDRVTISEIPAGVNYEVIEEVVNGYSVRAENNKGTITANTIQVAKFTNHKGTNPLTGDSNEPVLWAEMLVFSMIALAGIATKKKKHF